jgi:hypothetical protein
VCEISPRNPQWVPRCHEIKDLGLLCIRESTSRNVSATKETRHQDLRTRSLLTVADGASSAGKMSSPLACVTRSRKKKSSVKASRNPCLWISSTLQKNYNTQVTQSVTKGKVRITALAYSERRHRAAVGHAQRQVDKRPVVHLIVGWERRRLAKHLRHKRSREIVRGRECDRVKRLFLAVIHHFVDAEQSILVAVELHVLTVDLADRIGREAAGVVSKQCVEIAIRELNPLLEDGARNERVD